MSVTTAKKFLFKNIIFAFILLLGAVFCFSACGINSGFDDGPSATDIVTGNGTSSIVYGDYVYYVNGYTPSSEVGDTNVYGKVSYAAVYRTKLTDGKVVENDKQYDEDGNEIFDKTQGIKDTGILVPKICGYEHTKLYIFDNYLYYTTPGNQVAKDGTIQSDYIDFCRIKIDGHSRGEKLFTSKTSMSQVTYFMQPFSNKAYLIVLDGNILKIGECTKNGFSLKTIDEDYVVSSVAQTRYTKSDESIASIDDGVYFTYTNDDTTTGNLLAKYSFETKEISNVGLINNSEYTLIGSIGGRLYYNKSVVTNPGTSGAYLFYNTLDGSEFLQGERQLSNNAYSASNIYLFNAESAGAYVNNGSNIYKFDANGNKTQIIEGSATIIAQKGDFLFYTLDNKLYRKDLSSGNDAEELVELADNDAVKKTLSVVSKSCVFYMKEYTNSENTSYYFHMINTDIQTDDGNYDHFIGVLQEKDYLDEPTEE